jgi:hypothetical protein
MTRKPKEPKGDEEPQATAAPPLITEMQAVWVHHTNVPLAKNQVGYIWATKADAATMIAAGDAVDAFAVTMAGPYISASDPWPLPPREGLRT